MEGTVSLGDVRGSTISIFIAFLNRSRQADVVCITIYVKLLIIDRETNRQSSTGSTVSLVPWGHAEPGSDADLVPLLLEVPITVRHKYLQDTLFSDWYTQPLNNIRHKFGFSY